MDSASDSSQASGHDEGSLVDKIQQLEEVCNGFGSKLAAWQADGLEDIYKFMSQYIDSLSNEDPDAEPELDPEED